MARSFHNRSQFTGATRTHLRVLRDQELRSSFVRDLELGLEELEVEAPSVTEAPRVLRYFYDPFDATNRR